jgi:hypothetical protein
MVSIRPDIQLAIYPANPKVEYTMRPDTECLAGFSAENLEVL